MESSYTKYANALISLTKEENKLLEYKIAIKAFDVFLLSNVEVKKYLESYFVKNDEKYRVIDDFCKDFKLDYLSNYLKFLTQKHLIFHFHDLSKQIVHGINEELCIYDGFIYSTVELSPEKIHEVEEIISKKISYKVELVNILDLRLIGGIKVVVRDYVFDGSILYKVETMKQNLKERRPL